MKNKYVLFLAFFAALITVFAGCEKENTTPAKTKSELITASPWKFESATASGTDVSNSSQLTCFKDNIITFTTNAMFTVAEGLNVCTPSTAGTFGWTFQSNETQLVLSAPLFPGGSGTFNLVSLSETTLVVSQNVTIAPSPTPFLVVFTFKH